MTEPGRDVASIEGGFRLPIIVLLTTVAFVLLGQVTVAVQSLDYSTCGPLRVHFRSPQPARPSPKLCRDSMHADMLSLHHDASVGVALLSLCITTADTVVVF